MKVSIITVVLNNKATIKEAILSIGGQDYKNIEHIIIDGGSTDGTQSIIDKYRDRRAIFTSEKDNGIYEAMNKGLKIASGDIIVMPAEKLYPKLSAFLKKKMLMRSLAIWSWFHLIILTILSDTINLKTSTIKN